MNAAARPGRLDLALIYPALVLFALIGMAPFLWAVATSVKTPVDAFAMPPVLIFHPSFDAYSQLLQDGQFADYLLNSVIVTAGVVILSTVVGCLAGYGLARYTGLSSFALLTIALVLYALPRVSVLLPYYQLGQSSGLYDTKTLLIVVMTAANQPFSIWIFESFFREIPVQLEQAAMIDGCSRLQAFVRVVLPIAGPGMATTAIFSLLFAYNEFLLPVILAGPESSTMPVLIANYAGSSDVSRWPLFAATAVLVALPLLVIVITCQRFIVRGLVAGAVKG
jgi:ABC-type glycerol-3-phosphate transport system permease component